MIEDTKVIDSKKKTQRTPHILKKPVIQDGTEKPVGEEVMLTKQQADRLKESGHI